MEFKRTHWSNADYDEFIHTLKIEAEPEFREFQKKLIPSSGEILGIRTPRMRKIAKQISQGNYEEYLSACRSDTFEEVMIHGLVITNIKADSGGHLCSLTDSFLPLIDNWAVNDCFCGSLKQIRKYSQEFFLHLDNFLHSDRPWHVRAGLIFMLSHYLEEDTIEDVLRRCDRINMDHYYVRMGQAWLIATAYAKFRDLTHAYLVNCSLDDWTYNKAIQKCRESFRVSKEDKELLKSMKR